MIVSMISRKSAFGAMLKKRFDNPQLLVRAGKPRKAGIPNAPITPDG
jgi:hypothetical protein